MKILKLSKQPYNFGILYKYQSKYLERNIFVFKEFREFIDKEFDGLEGAIKFEELNYPGRFEYEFVPLKSPGFVFVKGHPYQSLITLKLIEDKITPSKNYNTIPLKKYFGTNRMIVTEYLEELDLGEAYYAIGNSKIGNLKVAASELFVQLYNIGERLKLQQHIDPSEENIFFRGIENKKFLFTLTDQYHCGQEELSHNREFHRTIINYR